MKRLRKIVGVLIMAASIILALYIGGWLLIIKPINEVAIAIGAGTVTILKIFSVIFKAWFGLLLGLCIAVLGIDIGGYLFWEEKE